MKDLAIEGGQPVRTPGSWPQWPTQGSEASELVWAALQRPALTVRAQWHPGETFDSQFAAAFAQSHDSAFAIPVSSGTTAIEAALLSLGIGYGDEVIVPALTWVATAIAVLRTGAIPVLADVDPVYKTLSPTAVEAALTSRTAALLPVHWHATVADMPKLTAIAERRGLAVVEDCAQAHGARLHGRMVGTWGDAGAFSLHNDKLISVGEGGVVTTSRSDCHRTVQALRLDGFEWTPEPHAFDEGVYAQADAGRVMGTSYALSEVSCALGLSRMRSFPSEITLREENGEALTALLAEPEGTYDPLPRRSGLDVRAFYEFSVDIPDSSPLSELRIEHIARALSAELGFPVYPEGAPLTTSELYRPSVEQRYAHLAAEVETRMPSPEDVPVSTAASERTLLFLHPPLLDSRESTAEIAEAFAKVASNADRLRDLSKAADGVLASPLPYLKNRAAAWQCEK